MLYPLPIPAGARTATRFLLAAALTTLPATAQTNTWLGGLNDDYNNADN